MKKILFKISLFYTALVNAQVTTVTLTTAKDAPIGYHYGASTEFNNYGYASQNSAFAIPSVAQVGGLNNNNALIDFNLTALPANINLISAKLNLYALGPYGPSLPGHFGSANQTYIERITQPWQENTVTWNNRPTSSNLNQLILPQSTNALQDYLNIDVTTLVQDMLNNPTTSFGFRLRLVNEVASNGLSFASKDNGNINKIPSLVITYNTNNVSIYENETTKINVSTFPNPTTNSINFNLNTTKTGNGIIYIYDALGKLINETSILISNNLLNNNYSINTSIYSKGIYSYSIAFEGEQKSGKFIIE